MLWIAHRMEVSMSKLSDRITVDPEQCGGRPCVRGMRILVVDVLDLPRHGARLEAKTCGYT